MWGLTRAARGSLKSHQFMACEPPHWTYSNYGMCPEALLKIFLKFKQSLHVIYASRLLGKFIMFNVRKLLIFFVLFCVGLKLCYWPEGKNMYGFSVTGRRNRLYNVEIHNMSSELDIINLKSRGVEWVVENIYSILVCILTCVYLMMVLNIVWTLSWCKNDDDFRLRWQKEICWTAE